MLKTMKKQTFTLLIAAIFSLSLFAQKEDPVLFKVDGKPVHVSEFNYIYSKTNGANADFSRKSLEEYLELYKRFKLKVHRAREMQLDTIESLRQELDGYRKQLADSYLIDKEVTDKLIAEVYDRTKKDVDISHIIINCSETASPEDTLKAYNKITEARAKLVKGEDFSKVAMEYSDDKSKEKNMGHVGFITAMLPNGFYDLETAAYTLKTGEISKPIRTRFGYHLIRSNGVREARGEMEVSHILVRVKDDADSDKAKMKIDSLYKLLKAGANFEDMARTNSDDNLSADKSGYIGFFGINRFERAFEDAAFALKNDNDYSEPFRTSIGWHVVKRISHKGIDPFNIAKPGLQNKVKNDARFELARKAMIERIKSGNNFTVHEKVLDEFIASLDTSFLTFRWKPSEKPSEKTIFSLGKDGKTSLGQFEDYLGRASRKRIRMAGNTSTDEAVRALFDDFVEEECLRYEERHLEEKYPDFKALMREYEEGIMLFEATKIEVWDRASQDSVGLADFFKTIEGKYKWKQRAQVSMYSLKPEAKDKIDAVREFAKNNPPNKVLTQFTEGETAILTVREETFEEGRNEVLDKMKWMAGELSTTEEGRKDQGLSFMKIEKIIPPGDKSLDDARGYVVADYQDFLEKKWIAELSKKYKVEINQKVFDSLVKK